MRALPMVEIGRLEILWRMLVALVRRGGQCIAEVGGWGRCISWLGGGPESRSCPVSMGGYGWVWVDVCEKWVGVGSGRMRDVSERIGGGWV